MRHTNIISMDPRSPIKSRERRERIKELYNVDSDIEFYKELYCTQMMSTHEISEYLQRETGISISARSIQRKLKAIGEMRNIKQSFNLAVKKGRVNYDKLKARSKQKRKRIPNSLRFEILTRDSFSCQLCGATRESGPIEVDHIIPVKDGGTNDPNNLRALCWPCHQAKTTIEGRETREAIRNAL